MMDQKEENSQQNSILKFDADIRNSKVKDIKERTTLPISKWNIQLRIIESSIRQDKTKEAYQEAKDLIANMINVFSERWDLGPITNVSNKRFIYNLRLVSPSLSLFFDKMLKYFPEDKSNHHNRDDILEIMYLLKACLFAMNPKDDKLSSIEFDSGIAPNSKTFLKIEENSDNIQKKSEEFTDPSSDLIDKNHKIWITLRKAILNFEYRSQ